MFKQFKGLRAQEFKYIVQGFKWFKSSNGSSVQMVQEFKWFKCSNGSWVKWTKFSNGLGFNRFMGLNVSMAKMVQDLIWFKGFSVLMV